MKKAFLLSISFLFSLWALAEDPIKSFGQPNSDPHYEAPGWVLYIALFFVVALILLWVKGGVRKSKVEW